MGSRSANVPATRPPAGFVYLPAFLAEGSQAALVKRLDGLTFGNVEMHGVVARREVLHFGRGYAYESRRLSEAPPPPEDIHELRLAVARAANLEALLFSEILLTRYPPGAPIGWHRDAPAFELIAGISLGAWCRFRLRRRHGATYELFETRLAPGSLYFLRGESRWDWEHHIPPVKALRYSITFRTEQPR